MSALASDQERLTVSNRLVISVSSSLITLPRFSLVTENYRVFSSLFYYFLMDVFSRYAGTVTYESQDEPLAALCSSNK